MNGILKNLIAQGTASEIAVIVEKAATSIVPDTRETGQIQQLGMAIGHLLTWLRDSQAIQIDEKDIGEIAEYNEIYALVIDRRIPIESRQAAIDYLNTYIGKNQKLREKHEGLEGAIKAGLKIMERQVTENPSEKWAEENAKRVEYAVLSGQDWQNNQPVTIKGLEFIMAQRTPFDTIN